MRTPAATAGPSSRRAAAGSASPARAGPLSAGPRSRQVAAGAWWDKKKGDPAPAAGKPRTLKELAERNSKGGAKSSSGKTYGFASKSKAYIEVEGTYLESGWVEQPKAAKKGGKKGRPAAAEEPVGFFENLMQVIKGEK